MNLFRFTFLIIILFIFSQAYARPFRVDQIPNGSVNGCANCHVNPAGGGTRNDFGKLVERNFLSSGNVQWGPVLASYDADGDGISNGAELQDPLGLWASGQPAPGNSALVTAPGSFINTPAITVDMIFSGFTPHIGQKLELRVVDRINLQEVERISFPSVQENFAFNLDGILPGHNYWIDFYTDHNGNGLYDAPPVDHAWRVEMNDPADIDSILFPHNTNFTDVSFPSLVSVSFSGMTPHMGQMIELRVEDEFGTEVGRKRIEAITFADFIVRIPAALKAGVHYDVEFYADLNGNKTYDTPPTDHAWKLEFISDGGDTSLTFAHNTNFDDISWDYQLIFVMTNMTPHLGQQLSARLLHSEDDEESGRVIIPAVPAANFSITLPGIEFSHGFKVDFYADHSGNKTYDAPPVDHAWRTTFTTGNSGDFAATFTHNTDFTDIQWPATSSVSQDGNAKPGSFALLQNYPNPFNPSTNFEFRLANHGFVTLKVYDAIGNEVAVLLNEAKPAGTYNVNYDAGNLSSGIYFYQLRSGNLVETRKMILMK